MLGATARAYVQVQIMSKMVRKRDWKSKSAD